jgi:DNA polymerase III subunit alpha
MSKFSHLHLHTEYSLLDGVLRIPQLIEALKERGATSCALTDHGNMYGTYKFWKGMKKEGMKPILGCEIYLAPRSHDKKEAGVDNKYYHLVLLAKNQQGYKNLMKVVSIGHMEGFYYKPRVDIETLEKYSEGIIALSACLSGPISRNYENGKDKKAEEYADKLAAIYKDHFYIEIDRNYKIGEETDEENKAGPINEKLIKLAKDKGLPIVATNDVHYMDKEDAMVQEVLWAIADGKTIDDPTRRRQNWDLSLRTEEEMIEAYKDLSEAISNTQVIADQIEDYTIEWDRVEPPYLDLPKDETPDEHLRKLVEENAVVKYGSITKEIQERIDYELGIISDKGYSNYFLVVYDFVNYCNANNIMVGARGSAVGTVVGYCLGIASVDPLKWGLIFERFLNPGRDSPPDVDLDISDKRREEVIKYAQDKYGPEQVRLIIAFSKLQTRAAIRDVSRFLKIDLEIADRLSKMVEVVFGKTKPIEYMIENNEEFAEIINSSPELQRMAEIVKKVAGLTRGVTTHACGVVVSPTPVDDYVPVQTDSRNNGGDGVGMSQFEMQDLENVGLLKLDFLGLRNLNILDNAVRKIKTHKGIDIDLEKVDTHDPKIYEMLQSGNTIGVFQMESEGMRKTVKLIKPEDPEEICYILAAYRPGPMEFIPEYVAVKQGEKAPTYLLPELEGILGVTNGVITYQEQVMKIANDIGGYSLSEADILRKAMGKKKMDIMEIEKPKFIAGGIERGHDADALEELWELLLKFANYGFNKSHAAAYAMISYYTAYLKYHYPMEFMAALLEGDLDNFERTVTDLQECDRLGIEVLPPSINKSDLYFSVEDDDNKIIRFGLGAIKNVGEDVVRKSVAERKENGDYLNLDDYIYRTIEGVQKRGAQYMIMAGAFDEFGDRNAMSESLEKLYPRYKEAKKSASLGQIDLFGGGGDSASPSIHIDTPSPLPDVEEMATFEKLSNEKELLGLYVSSHPLDDLQEFFQEKGAISIAEVLEKPPGRKIIITAAIAVSMKRHTTKKGDTMAFMQVEDKFTTMDVVVFPNSYERLKNELEANKPMLLAGKINERENGDKSFVLEKAKTVDPTKFGSNFEGITFKVRDSHTPDQIKELKQYIIKNGGDKNVRILVNEEGSTKIVTLTQKISLNDQTNEYLKIFR